MEQRKKLPPYHHMATLPNRVSTGQIPFHLLTEEQKVGLKPPVPLQQRLQEDPQAGPRPITIEEYRQRNKQRPKEVSLELKQQPKKRRRGGALTKFKKELGELHRMLVITKDTNLRKQMLQKIKLLEQKREIHRRRNKN